MNFLDCAPTNQLLFENIRKGDVVQIIRCPNSILNVYKGYIGEIKEYFQGQGYAPVLLYAINNQTIVKFPLNHFIKL
jgi:RimJ/RimL family protein N-acetyltransferase